MLQLDRVAFTHKGSSHSYRFSLTAQRGEILAIMGKSGSGKSTLLDLVSGFLRSDGGRILWEDVPIGDLPPEKRPVTILFQNHNLFEHLSAWRNVALGVSQSSRLTPEQEAIVENALQKVGLSGHEKQRASTLSGGQQQRVALARAIVRDKPVLLLDEPFSGLDETTKVDMLALVKAQAHENNRCILMVTHDRDECDAIADRVLLLEDDGILGELA